MSNKASKKLVGGLGTLLILVICAVVIGAYFVTEKNLQRIDIPTYVDTARDGAGGYTFTLNVERLLFAEHLIDPPEAELERYPEIQALKSLDVRVEQKDGAYSFETVSTSSDAHFNETLKAGGLKLVNTRWTWTKEQAEARISESRGSGIKLNYPDYIVTKRDADGSFSAMLDYNRLVRAANVDPDADAEMNAGLRALKSLGVACVKNADGWLLQATSTSETVADDLNAAGIRIVNTQWTWTEAEMEAHLGTAETPKPSEVPSETDAPESPDADGTPQTQETEQPSATPQAQATDKPARPENAITSLYGFDQTEVRKAIRAAKEAHYGSSLESGSVKYNYFAVGDASTEHANMFRLVYTITTSAGTEYLIADVYDLERETGYTANDVHLSTTTERSKAKSTEDLKGYTVHTLDGGSMIFPENKDKSPFDKNGLVMAKSISEALSYDELWNIPQTKDLTLLQLLGYARNEMFARGGHKFNDTSNYYKYFSQFDWYHPTGQVTATDLKEMYPATSGNITTIKFLEKLIKEG